MKLFAALIVVVAMTPSAWGQQLLLPDAASRDDAALIRAFADFARKTSNTELAADAGAGFLLQLAAGSYQEAVATATARRKPSPGAGSILIRLELYARFKAAEAEACRSERAFRKAFSDLIVNG
jgi:hypothetical protein